MAIFRSDAQPQKHHVVQIWQTPYLGDSWHPEVQPSSYLYKLGNPTLVRAMAECHEVLTLLAKDDTYGDLYLDLVKSTGDLLDTYFWLDREEVSDLRAPLEEIRQAASAALAEFEKVASIKKNTRQKCSASPAKRPKPCAHCTRIVSRRSATSSPASRNCARCVASLSRSRNSATLISSVRREPNRKWPSPPNRSRSARSISCWVKRRSILSVKSGRARGRGADAP
jgi:hypothetical protein